jgi:hypothetical protein
MNQVLCASTWNTPFSYTHLPLKEHGGTLKDWDETSSTPSVVFHFHRGIAVGDSNQAWSYDDCSLVSTKDWAASYNRRLNTTETDGSIKAEFQGTIQASSAYDIKEVGLYGNFQSPGGNNWLFLVSRDVLPSPISVQESDVVVVYYRITVGGT